MPLPTEDRLALAEQLEALDIVHDEGASIASDALRWCEHYEQAIERIAVSDARYDEEVARLRARFGHPTAAQHAALAIDHWGRVRAILAEVRP